MSRDSLDSSSALAVAKQSTYRPDVPVLSTKPTFGGSCPWELIDAVELARRWNIPPSWVRSHCRNRSSDEIPCIRLGRYVRFRWGSPELERWLTDHEEQGG